MPGRRGAQASPEPPRRGRRWDRRRLAVALLAVLLVVTLVVSGFTALFYGST